MSRPTGRAPLTRAAVSLMGKRFTGSETDCYRVEGHGKDASRSGPVYPEPSNRAQTEGMDQAARALSYLISGVLVWGGLGWLADHFLHTGFLIPIGIVIGAGLACYLIIVRFGQEAERRRRICRRTSFGSRINERSTTPSAVDMSN